MRKVLLWSAGFVMLAFCAGCGHVKVCHVGLLSNGDLDGKKIPLKVEGPVLAGKDSGARYYLSNAVREALSGTDYDTLVDVEVTSRTGLFVWSNEIEVRGTALDSRKIVKDGGDK